MTDGPFAEHVEQIGGYYVVELPDLDVADRRLPAAARGLHGRDPSVGAIDGARAGRPADAGWQPVRDEWGRLRRCCSRVRRLDLAEDALADAFEAAARPGRATAHRTTRPRG